LRYYGQVCSAIQSNFLVNVRKNGCTLDVTSGNNPPLYIREPE
jgi:hypothetical protein